MVDKPTLIDIPIHVDDRGTVHCSFDNLNLKYIKRTYIIKNWHKGMIRAWHGHKDADTYMHVISGVAKLAAVKIGTSSGEWVKDCYTYTVSADVPKVLYIPRGYYNGSVSLYDNTRILVYSTLSFDEVKNDDYRKEISDGDRHYIFGVKHR